VERTELLRTPLGQGFAGIYILVGSVRPVASGWRSRGCGRVSGVTGEEFLRQLADEIIAERDLEHWWERFSMAFDGLDLVGAVDEETGRQVGEDGPDW
jgi:hypothetical protein